LDVAERRSIYSQRQFSMLLWCLDTYIIRFENLSLTFRRNPKKSPLPWWEGMVGRGDQTQSMSLLSTPTPPYRQAGLPSPIEGGGIFGKISNIFG